jgi:hypothetical protein
MFGPALPIDPFAMASFISSYSAFTEWLPIVFIALVGAMSLVAIYYAIGVMLNNGTIRKTAVSEIGQVIGTGIIVIVILLALPIFGSLFTVIVPHSTVSALCSQLSQSKINMLSTSSSQANSPTSAVCNLAAQIGSATGAGVTAYMDYGMAATYVITASMAEQSGENLNSLYVFLNYIGFLGSFNARAAFCTPPSCIEPLLPRVGVEFSYAPLAGYTMITKAIQPIQTQAVFMLEAFMAQILFIAMFFYAWPYILGAGMILRATIYGRGVGGFLMASAIVALVLYPTVFLMEYAAFSNGTLSPIGTTSIPNMQIYELPIGQSTPLVYKFNPYVFPKIDQVINYNKCWLPGVNVFGTQVLPANNMLEAEVEFAAYYLIPALSTVVTVSNMFSGGFFSYSSLPYVPTSCKPNNLLSTYFQLLNVYGVMAVAGILLPILNLLIGLTAVRSVSFLLGGDTDLLGIGKLI